ERVVDGPVVMVPMGQSRVAGNGTLLRSLGLGSCLAVIIFAPRQGLAGVAHCMLPHADQGGSPASKYVDTAIPDLLHQLSAAGASEPFSATLVGGASMFPAFSEGVLRDIAGGNVSTARTVLTNSAVPVRSEDVGGHVGRSVLVDPSTQRVIVHTIREGDRCL
ncbi:MAG TPA: hypothetical protein VE861_00100, partial [Gemmatimonadaceae bacterium]|nr:hypothetical protein [Gemmatimonadaceae bacterium]